MAATAHRVQTDFYRKRDAEPLPEAAAELRAEIERLRPLAELGRMSATVAHEVRNPLAGISANAELLRESLTRPDDLEAVDIILGEVERLSRLVTDLLHYTRERAPAKRPLDLARLVRQVADLASAEAGKAGVEVVAEGRGLAVGDEELSRQALLNLVRNAVQASPAGGRVDLRADGASVSVADRGHGVPETIRPRLFEPFVTGRTRGLGLGMAVARRCLRRQGGEVVLADTGPTGTCFVLTWPVKE